MTSNYFKALTRIKKFLFKYQAKRLSETCLMSVFENCPLKWMFCGKTENNSINKTHKRTLRLIFLNGGSNI